MSGSIRGLAVVVLAAVFAGGSGCSSWQTMKHDLPWSKDEPQVPTKVVAMWTNTVLSHVDRPSTRGFGGRLMFYAGKEEKPVMVEGSLVVYGFDETRRKKDDPRPDRKYIFTPEQFAKHYSKSALGHSYSVWLPWDDAMGSSCKVSLIVRFIPKQGAIVLGEQTAMIVPGPGPDDPAAKPETAARGADSAGGIRQVSHEVEVPRPLSGSGGLDPVGSQVRTTTIQVPLQSRLTRGPSQAFAPAGAAPAGAAIPSGAAAPRMEAQPAPMSSVPRSSRFTLPRSRPLGDPIPLPRADRAGWPLPVAAARNATENATPQQ